MSEDRGPWMETFTGKKFYPLTPRAEDVSIFDIAHALSNICRFGGHTKHYYSVAQHCITGADWVFEQTKSTRLSLDFLLHDAAEAYIGDMIRPIKSIEKLRSFKTIESDVMGCIHDYVFGIEIAPDDPDTTVTEFDNLMLAEEAFHLTANKTLGWDVQYQVEQRQGHVNPDSLAEISRYAIEKMYLEDFFSLYVKLFDKLHKDDNIHNLKEDHGKEKQD